MPGCTEAKVSSSRGPLKSLYKGIIFLINAYRGFQYEKFLFRYIIPKIANNCPERWLSDVYQSVANTEKIGTLLVGIIFLCYSFLHEQFVHLMTCL